MTDTRLHFYFNEDNYSDEGSHSICVDNGEENIIYLIYDREESVFADIINNESNETTNYFEAVDIYSLDNDEFGDFNNILSSSENSLETVMEYIEVYPSLTLLGTLDYSGIVTGEMIEEFYIGELESSHSTLITNSKTVSSLYIHNKEVQSIITSDNVVLYEKENSVTPVVSDPVNILDNVSFTHSDGTTSRNVSYINNESTTMSVQGLKDVSTPAINGEIDFLLGVGESYRDITLETNVEYDLTGYDFDIIQLNNIDYKEHNVLKIEQYTVGYNARDEYHIGNYDEIKEMRVKNNVLYLVWWNGNEFLLNTLTNLKITAYVNNIIVRVYNCRNYSLIDTQTTNNQGYASYEYEATGQGEFYIKAQSHNDSTITTNDYLISDWIYKDFTNYGGWSAFSGRNTSSMSISDNTLRVTSGNKGGAHSINTIFNLPNDDYEVSFKITETTKTDSNGVRIGIHSANYSDHHEKACCGIAYVGGTGNKVSFDYSNNNVTAVTKEVIADNLTVGDIIRFRVEGTTLKCYHNDSLYVTETLAWLHDPMWLYAQSWGTGTANISITDFRVKRIINN